MMAKRVFVVDDERIIADTLAAILARCGYDVNAFYDAESALTRAESLAPDLVISDVVMPQMNGVDMAIVMTKRFPSCRVLLFSGQAATSGMLKEARLKGHDFELLAKPIHPKDLLAKLEPVTERPLTPTVEDLAAGEKVA
jgi:DNA-binding NtrC family response regulator